MTESGVIAKTAFVFGQMNEPPGARQRVGPDRPDDGRVLPRRRGPRRPPLHRQHLPVHPGRLGGVGAARPDAVGRRLPAESRHRDGRPPGADHLDEEGLDHVAPGGLRARRRLHRPGPGDHLRPPRLDDPPRAQHRRARHLPRGRPADLDVARPRPAGRRPGALRRRPRDAARPAALPRPPGHHRHPRHRRAVRGGQDDRRPRPPAPALRQPADVRRRGVHRPARQVRADEGHRRVVQGDPRGQGRHPARAGVLPRRHDGRRARQSAAKLSA